MSLVTIGLALIGLGFIIGFIDLWLDVTWDATGAFVGAVAIFIGIVLLIASVLPEEHQHWVGPETLAMRACSTHQGVRGTTAIATFRGGTDGFLVTCNDSRVIQIPDGKREN